MKTTLFSANKPRPWPNPSPPNSNKLPRACSWEREADAPFEVISWSAPGALTRAKLLQLTNHPPNAPVEVASVDELLARATQQEDWHDEEERETVQRFQNKVSVLKQNKKAVAGFQGGQYQHRALLD